MTELEIAQADRYQLITYLVARVYPRAGARYVENVHSALQKQSTEILRAMARETCRQELERRKRRQDLRAQRRQDEHKHTTTRGAR